MSESASPTGGPANPRPAEVPRPRQRQVGHPPSLGAWVRQHWFITSALFLSVIGLAAFDAWLVTCAFEGCPSSAEIQGFSPSEGSKVYDRSGRLIGKLHVVRRVNVPLSRVPAHVRQAFLATEDRRFYEHRGVDWRAVVRASFRNIRSFGVREGFSTITMQLARNTFLSSRGLDRTIARKFLELRVARLIESELNKDKILEHYLNAIYLGNGVYGVEGASRDLFGKRVHQLTVAEGAMLAALPKGPSSYTPRRDHDRALGRRNLVLSLMEREGYLDHAQYTRARSTALKVAKNPWRPQQPNDSYALDAIRAVVDSALWAAGEKGADVIVYTTLDLNAQRAADKAVRRRAEAIEQETRWDWWSGDGPTADNEAARVEGAMVAVDPRNGDIRALVGGRTYRRGSFNRAIMARRQPGSAFKPFVYATALASGLSPASLVDDVPVELLVGNNMWRPANYGHEYSGRVTLRRALMRSANAATVRISQLVGERQVAGFAQRLGIQTKLPVVPALALGAAEVTPLELVTAYAAFANGGHRVTPRIVERITRVDGTTIWSRDSVEPVEVMDPRDAYQLTSMLQSAIDHGTGRAVRSYGIQGLVAGKTGTTNNGSDVWFVGYTPTLVAGFWFGYDNPRSLGSDASGGRLAAPAWAEFYRDGWKERSPSNAWDPPSGMVERLIDPQTGELAGEWCPRRQAEWFKPEMVPTTMCREHEWAPEWTEWDLEGDDWSDTMDVDTDTIDTKANIDTGRVELRLRELVKRLIRQNFSPSPS